jgi:glyoxylate reductase
MAKPTVLIARVLLPAGRELLAADAELREGGLDATPERIADPTVRVDDALLDAAGPGLRVVANFAVGTDNIDLEACRARGIPATNTPDVLTNATAELALALTLAAARGATGAERTLRAGEWSGWDPGAFLGLELSGAVFAVIGLGRIG